jgi:lipid-binding SYLF domain-containing protein
MIQQYHFWRKAAAAVQASVLLAAASVAAAQSPSTPAQMGGSAAGSTSSSQSDAVKRVAEATDVVNRMAQDPGLAKLLGQAKGLYIVPSYGRAALGLGASGGAGVLVVKRADGSWSDPAFFNMGGLSIGLQAGAEGGQLAMVLVNEKAVASFRNKNNFSLSADAGLTVVDWNKYAQGSAGKGDVVAWAGTKGLFGNAATLAFNDIRFNQRATDSYYGKAVTAQDLADGKVTNPRSDPLKQSLAAAAGGAAK